MGSLPQSPISTARPSGRKDVVYPLTLGEGEYFCMGDNRGNSLDSRNYGPVDSNEIEGKALTVFRIF